MKTPRTIYLKDYTPPAFIVDSIDLTFDIREDETMVTSKLNVRRNMDRADQNTALVFDKGGYEILSVIAAGLVLSPGEYGMENESFTLAGDRKSVV